MTLRKPHAPDARHGRCEHRQEGPAGRVDARREDLRAEHLSAVDRACQDRLEGAVGILVGDDVAGDERGNQGQEESGLPDQGEARRRQARLRYVRGKDVLGVPRAGVEQLGDHQDQRDQDADHEAEIGAVLGAQLAQLPAQDRGGRRAPRLPSPRDSCGGGGGAHTPDSSRLGDAPSVPAGSWPSASASPSVRRKKSSSSVASSGRSE